MSRRCVLAALAVTVVALAACDAGYEPPATSEAPPARRASPSESMAILAPGSRRATCLRAERVSRVVDEVGDDCRG